MLLNLNNMNPAHIYFNMTQTLIPRPIAWVLTENETSDFNLAPFSYFNAVSSNPPLIMLSIGKKPDGSDKDTHINIKERGDFVVHIAHREMLEALNQSSETLPPNTSELDKLGLETTDFEGSRLPRIKNCRVAYACESYQVQEIGNTPQVVIFGKVNAIYIDDGITSYNNKGHLKIHADKLAPVSRLGANEYMEFGKIIPLVRPK